MSRAVLPFARWSTKVTPDMLASTNLRLAYPAILDDLSWVWVEGRPHEGGRQVVVRKRPGSAARDLVPAPFDARSLVHEYGGRPYVFAGDDLVFSNRVDGRLYRVREGEEPRPLGPPSGFRVAEAVVDAERNRLVAVGERHAGGGYPENGLVTVQLDTGEVDWLVRGHDFFAAPAISPDGHRIAYLAWDHPHMPWDGAALHEAVIASDGTVGEVVYVGGGASGSAFQPTWSPSGELYFALESGTEPWSLHRKRGGRIERVLPPGAEWGAPLWNLGTTIWAFSSPREIVAAPTENGMTRLVRADVERGTVEPLALEVSHVGQLAVRGDSVLFTVGWAGAGTEVIHLDAGSGRATVARNSLAHLFAEGAAGHHDPAPRLTAGDISAPEPVRFPTTDGDEAHGFFHAPKNSRYEGPAGTLPPLLVLAHGGPTGCASPALQLAIVHFTTRGFAVLDVNYRGSVGFGRAYRERLRGRWGVMDVDDCVYGALAMAREGRVDGKRLVIRGGSAGGFTVLMALAMHPEVFAAATCLYGVSDPRTLSAETHKFESHYDRFLFGATPEERERAFDERAPLALAHRIKTPVIFFQGLEDKAVLPSQTEGLYRVLKGNGVETEYHGYAGEQHGFRKAETVCDLYEKERAFHERVLGIESTR